MAPKRDNTSKKQNQSGAGTSRAQESYDQTRFNGPEQQQRFDELMERCILPEIIFSINPEEGTPFSFSTKVAGRTIHFNRDAISEFLGDPLILKEGQLCCYQTAINAEANVDKISKAILLEGRSVVRNSSEVAICYHRDDLKPEAQVLLFFIIHNIHPNMQPNEGQQFMQSNEGQQFMTPDEFVAHIVWPRDKPFYQEEGAGPEEKDEAGTSGGSKTASEVGNDIESESMGRE
ncbi:hypothetical protein RYX36_012885 [Vicia faba]